MCNYGKNDAKKLRTPENLKNLAYLCTVKLKLQNMDNTLLLIFLAGAAYYFISKKSDKKGIETPNTGGGSGNNGGGIQKPNIDPGTNQYNPNAEHPDLKVRGYFRFGNIPYAESQGSLDIIIKNTNPKTAYLIKSVAADLYYNGVRVLFKNSQEKKGTYVVNPNEEVTIRLGHSPVYFTSERQKLYDLLCRTNPIVVYSNMTPKYYPRPRTDLGNIMECDVDITWEPRNGSGTPQEASYIGKECSVRYVDDTFLGD